MKIVTLTATATEVADLSVEELVEFNAKVQPFCKDVLIHGDRFTVIFEPDYLILNGTAAATAMMSARGFELKDVQPAPITLEQRVFRLEHKLGILE